MMEEGIHQRTAPMTRRRMDDQAGWFIQDQQDVVFVENLEWDRFPFECQRLRFWNVEGNPVARPDLVAGLDDLTVDPNTSLLYKPLQCRSG